MKKVYVIDTSVLAYDPQSYRKFTGLVVLPINVLDEIDKLKKFPGEVGKNARHFSRAVDELSKLGQLHIGIKIDKITTIKVDTKVQLPKVGSDSNYTDNKILACALSYTKSKTKVKPVVVVVSRDVNLRIRARSFGMLAEDYTDDRMDISDLYTGAHETINEKLGYLLCEKEEVHITDFPYLDILNPNEYLHVTDANKKGLCIARRIKDKLKIVHDSHPWGLELRNKEQAFAANAIMDTKIPLVTLTGVAGTGKTLVTMAAALQLVLADKTYQKVMVYRPMEAVGKDVGYLPGLLSEKLSPWMGSIDDALDFLFDARPSKRGGVSWRDKISPQHEDRIEYAAMTFIRGRSIPNTLLIIDEAQNTSKEEIKTILTRVSKGTKILVLGDIEQNDRADLDAVNNGLSYVIEKFKDSDLAAHVTFKKGERSPLAEAAAKLL